jgi:hypothetical protein
MLCLTATISLEPRLPLREKRLFYTRAELSMFPSLPLKHGITHVILSIFVALLWPQVEFSPPYRGVIKETFLSIQADLRETIMRANQFWYNM